MKKNKESLLPNRIMYSAISRNFYAVFTPFILLLCVTVILLFRQEQQSREGAMHLHLEQVASQAVRQVCHAQRLVLEDLLLLANGHELRRYVENGIRDGHAVAEHWRQFMLQRQRYRQLRFLDGQGVEQVRLDFDGQQARPVAPEQFPDPQSRHAFREAMALAPGQVYASPIEWDAGQAPHAQSSAAMIRYATQITDSRGMVRGVLVVDYLAAQLLEPLRGLQNSLVDGVGLIPAHGHWLIGPPTAAEQDVSQPDGGAPRLEPVPAWLGQLIARGEYGTHVHDGTMSIIKSMKAQDLHPVSSPDDRHMAVSGCQGALVLQLGKDRFLQITGQQGQHLLLWLLVASAVLLLTLLFATVAWRQSRALIESRIHQRLADEQSGFLRAVMDSIGDGLLIVDGEGRVLERNPAAQLLFAGMADDGGSDHLGHYLSVNEEGGLHPGHFEVELPSRDGAVAMLDVAVYSLEDGCSIVLMRDVTERLTAQQQMRLLSSALAQTDDMVLIAGQDGRIEYANRALQRATGSAEHELIGRQLDELPAAGAAFLHEAAWDALNAGSSWRDIIPFCRRDGELFYVERTINPLQHAPGEGGHFIITARDITERQEAADRLSLHEKHTPLAVIRLDRALAIEQWNPAATRIFEYGGMEVLGRNILDMMAGSQRAEAERFLRRVLDGQAAERVTLEGQTKSGRRIFCDWYVNPIRTPAGEIRGLAGLVQDVTESQQNRRALLALNRTLEERVRMRTQELEQSNRELEAFSYSVSHDLKAPLRSVREFSQLLMTTYGDLLEPRAVDFLQRIHRAGLRMGELIDDLLELSQLTRQPLHLQPVELGEIAREIAADLLAGAVGRKVEWRIADPMPASADPRLIRILLENLLGNAWKFSRGEALACIEFGCSRQGMEVIYHVRDNGAGFDMRYSAQLFTPFHRLHSDREFEGSGIGLATVQRIIHRHGGRIWAESEPGHGATFYFTLKPATENDVSETTAAAAAGR